MHMFVMVKKVAAGAVCLHSKVSDITQGIYKWSSCHSAYN